MILTKQIEPISNDALASDIKIGSLAALPVTLDTSSITAALTSLYTALKTTFIALNDTPATYAGQAYKFTKVAQAENALQFSSMRENVVGNIGINYAGAMSSLAYRMLIDDSVVTNSAALSINKNYGYTALEVTSGAGAHGLTVQTDSGDVAQFTGQYSGAMVVKYSGRVGIGLSSPSNRLHVAWRSGDTVSTMYVGSSATGNNQTAIDAESYSAAAIRGNTITGSYAMQGISSANGSFGVYGFSPTASGIKGTGAVYGGWFESSAGTALYVHTGSVRFAPLAGSGIRMLTADSSGILGTQSLPTTGITSLNGLNSATQAFINDTNVTLTSTGSNHALGWTGQLPIARGGTGASTANTALNNLLPAQISGRYLYSSGTDTSWQTFPTPAKTRFVSSGFLGLSAPYYTSIQTAIDDAESGDLVTVYAGTYTEYLTLKDGVNLYLCTGVVVRYAGTIHNTIYANNVDCVIDGFGVFEHEISTSLSVITIAGTSNVTIRCKRIHSILGHHAITMLGTGKAVIYADEIFDSTNLYPIYVAEGTLELTAGIVRHNLTGKPILYQVGGTVRISNTRCEASYPAFPPLADTYGIINKDGGTMILAGCTLINSFTYATVYSIGGSSAQDVKIYNTVANTPAHANINFLVQALVVDPNVS